MKRQYAKRLAANSVNVCEAIATMNVSSFSEPRLLARAVLRSNSLPTRSFIHRRQVFTMKLLLHVACVMAFCSAGLLADESVVNSKHDLSARGPGPIRAVHEDRVCIFCHTPHNAAPQTPLWNRENPRTHYRIYQSSTLDARVDQPRGSSKLCLSCHDGSLALGNVLSRPLTEPIVMTARTIPPGSADLSRDLSDDHPIGFRYDRAVSNADKQIRPPEVISGELPLGSHGEMQCTTCHDPHNNELGDFLRLTDEMSTLCITCHDLKGWRLTSHATSGKRTTGRIVDPTERLKYATVRDNGCMNCHKIHAAPHRQRLLRFRKDNDGCLNCHSGTVATYNIASNLRKRSAHYSRLSRNIHDPAETPFSMRRHVVCADCHNPHAVQPNHTGRVRGTLGQVIKGPNLHASGITITGRETDSATFGYEVCLKCHADGVTRPRLDTARVISQTNTRLEFQTSNPSFHPVAGPRRNSDVVSLIAPLKVGSTVTCIDCHNSDSARAFGGSGANGPHGSRFEPMLVRNYETDDFTPESAGAYALCYGCHNRQSILADESFARHRRHVVDLRTPCSACHDAHGIYRGQGNSVNNSSLINFDLSIVQPADTPTGRRAVYEDTGRLAGNCTLTCHGFTHIRLPYSSAGTSSSRVRSGAALLGAK